MSEEQLRNKVKYAKAANLLRTLLRQGLIDAVLFAEADRICAGVCR